MSPTKRVPVSEPTDLQTYTSPREVNMATRPLLTRMVPAVLLVVLAMSALAAPGYTLPPERINYQGVLRDQNGVPLTGTYDMTFRFFDSVGGSNELLVDQHTAATGNAISVSGGLLDVALGTGTVSDGSGPGTYTLLSEVFRVFTDVWLEIRVGTETLSPRTQIQSVPYALNASNLGNHPNDYFLNTSSTAQTKFGNLLVDTGNADPAIRGFSSSAAAPGVSGSGSGTGGVFTGGNYGLTASGSIAGRFTGPNGVSPYVELGKSTKALEAGGNVDYAGYFDTNLAGST